MTAGETHKEATADLGVHEVPPEETNYSVIAKWARVTRHTVSKHYKMIQKMLGIKGTAPPYFTGLSGEAAYDTMTPESEKVPSYPCRLYEAILPP